MILLVTMWLVAVATLVALLVLASVQMPAPVASAPAAHARASMRLVFVAAHDGLVVLDGLLDLDPPSLGVPTTWSFSCPDQPVLAAATLHVLEGWADDGGPVCLDLSKVDAGHPSVGFSRDEVQLRLSVPRSVREQA